MMDDRIHLGSNDGELVGSRSTTVKLVQMTIQVGDEA
jgi:hypothetical protein